MKKQLNYILVIFVFLGVTFNVTVCADQAITLSRTILKQEIISSISSRIEIINENTCYFKPANKTFNSKIVVNCDRIFDALLEEITSGESKAFEKSELENIIYLLDPSRLLQLVKNDFQFIREKINEQSISDESKNEVIIEICRIINLFLSSKDIKFISNYSKLKDIVLYFNVELTEIFSDLTMEVSVAKMGKLIQEKLNEEYELSSGLQNLDFLLFLDILYGNQEQVKSKIIKLININPDIVQVSLGNALSKLENLESENISYFSSFFGVLDKCTSRQFLSYKDICNQVSSSYGEEFEDVLAKKYFSGLKNKLLSIKPNDFNLSTLEDEVGLYNNSQFRNDFILNFLSPYFKKLVFENENDLKKACLITGEVPCSLTIKNQIQTSKNLIAYPVALILIIIIPILLYLRVNFRKKPQVVPDYFEQRQVENDNFNLLELTADERSELRQLRAYFDLKPLDSITVLHQNYRKMVFRFHPDKLNDGGKEFILLQSHYLRTKELLERLDKERAKKLSNS